MDAGCPECFLHAGIGHPGRLPSAVVSHARTHRHPQVTTGSTRRLVMIGSRRRRAASAADVARGLAALVVLTVLVVGVPVALWVIDGSPLPSAVPAVSDVWATITSPDDGTFFLDVLVFAGWLGWATFAVSVLVEI